MKAASVTKEMQQRYDAYPRLVEALKSLLPKDTSPASLDDLAEVNNLLENLGGSMERAESILRELGEL